ncbi:MAG: hypothetical protein HZA78_12450 [Candidatus Schekmanbacteria bacterium]|nr:hypothetical protein [Candidatus Schekmanbacteria bacterium]
MFLLLPIIFIGVSADLRYNINMSNNLLIKTNSYLKNPVRRRQLLYTTAVSSTAIEGVHAAAVRERNCSAGAPFSPRPVVKKDKQPQKSRKSVIVLVPEASSE